jgi:hypothetical protein
MERFEKIALIEHEVEANCLREELNHRGIPHGMRSYYDSAYDGLFQFSAGWGHVEAPADRKDEILKILRTIRQDAAGQRNEADQQEDNAGSG